MADAFKGLVLRETDGKVTSAIETLTDADLPDVRTPDGRT